MSGMPSYYVYEDSDGWHKTDANLTAKLNSPTFNDPSILAGHSFYPQWPEPEMKTETRVAWRITPDGYKVVRNSEITTEKRVIHKARLLRWDSNKRFWVLVAEPTPQQNQQIKRGGKKGA